MEVSCGVGEGARMRITYDPEGDALYIELRRVRAHDSVDIEEGVTADLDENGQIIGLEVLMQASGSRRTNWAPVSTAPK